MLASTARKLTDKNRKTASTVLVEALETIRYRAEHGDARTTMSKHYSGLTEEVFASLMDMFRELGYTVEPSKNSKGESSLDEFNISW